MYLCLCKGITDSQVRTLGREGVVSPEALAAELGIDRDDCCGRCLSGIADLAALAQSERLRVTLMTPTSSSTSS